MNKLLILSAIFLFGCTKTIYVPSIEYIKGKDSIRIEKRDSIIYIETPPQIQNVITNQKSRLSTDYSFSLAYVDSVGLLHHSIRNNAKIPLKIVYKDVFRIKTDSVYKYKERITEKKVPVTPSWCWWLIGLIITYFAIKWRKFFGSPI